MVAVHTVVAQVGLVETYWGYRDTSENVSATDIIEQHKPFQCS